MSRKKKPVAAELQISDFDRDGFGLASYEGPNGLSQQVSVPWTMPGDQVQATLLGKKRGIRQSFLEEVLAPSANREVPRCKHFAQCGGCRWQHVPYQMQLQTKEDRVKELFSPHASEECFRPIIPCEPPWQYRNKMEFSFSENREGEHFLGLMRSRGRGKVEDLSECHLVKPWFMDAVAAARDWWAKSDLHAYHPPSDRGSLRNLTVREGMNSGDRMVILLVSGNPDYALNRKQLDAFTQAMQEAVQPEKAGAQLSLFLRIQQCQKGKPTQFYEMELGGPAYIRELLTVGEKQFEFQISPTAFFQPNTRQAERLYAAALDLVQLPQSSHIYDLYAGTGTLGIIASSFVKIVTSIELVPEATLDAEANAKINNVDNLNILTGDVGEHLARLQREDSWESPDLIMVDPPRMGLDEQAIQHLFFAKPTQILYISCNPKTQAENVGELVKYGYQVTAVQAVDQFPHTVHVENIVVLRCG